MTKYLSIAELAEQADIPNSTCRRYLTAFEAFFIVKGGARLKKYESGAVDVLRRVKQLYAEGQDTNEIHNVLLNEFPLVIDGDKQEEQEKTSGLATSEDAVAIRKELEEIKAFNVRLVQEMENQRLFYEKKFAELKHDRELLDSLKNGMEQRKLESADHETEMTKQLKDIESQLSEIQQNETVKLLSEQVTNLSLQFENMMKEAASSQEKKKGFLSRFFK
jgi:DNA-dependent RNA polymerase auxiliary subunit epsilon